LWQTQASRAQQGLNCRHRFDAHHLWADAHHRSRPPLAPRGLSRAASGDEPPQ
jgi:hypothetical protein